MTLGTFPSSIFIRRRRDSESTPRIRLQLSILIDSKLKHFSKCYVRCLPVQPYHVKYLLLLRLKNCVIKRLLALCQWYDDRVS